MLPEIIVCPACHGENPPDAVFCGDPQCGKALGEFAYVSEEFNKDSTIVEKIADRVTQFTGKPAFVFIHVFWFMLWFLINSGLITASLIFDSYPFEVLTLLLSIEAVLITAFLLISAARRKAHEDHHVKLEYEYNIRTYRILMRVEENLKTLEKNQQQLTAETARQQQLLVHLYKKLQNLEKSIEMASKKT